MSYGVEVQSWLELPTARQVPRAGLRVAAANCSVQGLFSSDYMTHGACAAFKRLGSCSSLNYVRAYIENNGNVKDECARINSN